MEHTLEQLAREGNGAVEVAEPVGVPLKVVLAGPIRVWWSEWGSDRHEEYSRWRDAARVTLVRAGFLVYNPHRAWQGAWHEDAQQVNDAAIAIADVVVVLTPAGVPAAGTEAEMRVAHEHGVPVVLAPPGGPGDLAALLATIADLPPAPQPNGAEHGQARSGTREVVAGDEPPPGPNDASTGR